MTITQYQDLTETQFKVYCWLIYNKGLTLEEIDYEWVKEAAKTPIWGSEYEEHRKVKLEQIMSYHETK